MSVPGTLGQLLILLLFVLPGSVFQTVSTRWRGPVPSDQDATNKILRALAVSTVLNAIYLVIFGPALLRPLAATSVAALEHIVGIRTFGTWALVCLFLVPAALATCAYWWSRSSWVDALWERLPFDRPAYHRAPRTWDYAFTDIGPGFIRIQSAGGQWNGGWFGYQSSAASFPEPLEVFIEEPWRMGADGEFEERLVGSSGIYVRCDDARVVEFFDATKLAEDAALASSDEPKESA